MLRVVTSKTVAFGEQELAGSLLRDRGGYVLFAVCLVQTLLLAMCVLAWWHRQAGAVADKLRLVELGAYRNRDGYGSVHTLEEVPGPPVSNSYYH